MKKVLSVFFLATLLATPACALPGNYGDLMLLYAPPITDPVGISVERNIRNYEEALLHMGIPQYVMEEHIRDEALIRNELFYHVEICAVAHEYEKLWGMDWKRYRFTDTALQLLSVGQTVDVHLWIVCRQSQYKLPLEETRQLYGRYVSGEFEPGRYVPVELMIGTEYGQTLEDYTNFRDFYGVFMNKHHYCIPAVFWAIQKSMYDYGDEDYRAAVDEALADSQRVQSFDTLTAGRLIGMLLGFGLIEEY